jgi:hypothetical protein
LYELDEEPSDRARWQRGAKQSIPVLSERDAGCFYLVDKASGIRVLILIRAILTGWGNSDDHAL